MGCTYCSPAARTGRDLILNPGVCSGTNYNSNVCNTWTLWDCTLHMGAHHRVSPVLVRMHAPGAGVVRHPLSSSA